MFETLIAIIIAVTAFGVLLPLIVFVHEYGHFKVARLCGIRVDAFSIGFGKALKSWVDKKGTVWKISAIPLGGYVKFFGDANAASAGISSEDGEAEKPVTTQFNSERDKLAAMLTEEEKKVCFHFKPVWQRAAVVAAGPMANFLLALVIFATLFMTAGYRTETTVIGHVAPNSAAAEAGILPGDEVVRIGNARIDDFEDLSMKVKLSAGAEREFIVLREGNEVALQATPRRVEQTDALGNTVYQGQLGVEMFVAPVISRFADDSPAKAAGLEAGDRIISIDGEDVFTFSDVTRAVTDRPGETIPVVAEREGRTRTYQITVLRRTYTDPATGEETVWGTLGADAEREPFVRLGPLAATQVAAGRIADIVDGTLTYLGRLVTFQEDPRQLGGPIKIAKYAGQAVSLGFDEQIEAPLHTRLVISLTTFIQLAALISVSIGLLNLLPVPVLDGGHLVYYAYEAVAGRPLSDRIQGIGFRIGMVLVGSMMVFVVANDLMQLF